MFGNNYDYGIGGMYQNSFPTMQNNGFGMQGYNSPVPTNQNANMPSQATPKGNMDWIYVNTADDVAKVSVQPNGKAWIMISNDSIFALKTSDNVGVCNTDFYRFEKINGVEKKAVSHEFVTRDEVASIIDEKIKELTATKTKKGGKADE